MRNSRTQRKIILASRSPRRRYLLEQAGLTFSVIPSTRRRRSRAPFGTGGLRRGAGRSQGGRDRRGTSGAVGYRRADTIVCIDDMILGKPASQEEARAMLERLSGQTHVVVTGYCIRCTKLDRKIVDHAETRVRFKTLSPGEIEWYVHTDEPFDKAGAYAIQGLGTFLVKAVDGSYTNVVGLPVCEVIEFLLKEDVIRFRE